MSRASRRGIMIGQTGSSSVLSMPWIWSHRQPTFQPKSQPGPRNWKWHATAILLGSLFASNGSSLERHPYNHPKSESRVGASWLREAPGRREFHEELVLQGGVGILDLRKIELQYRGSYGVIEHPSPPSPVVGLISIS